MSESKKCTITLSDRPPVTVAEDDWPVIAQAEAKEYDGQYEAQANRTSRWRVRVRARSDSRTIVYAVYEHMTSWQNSRNYQIRHGVLTPAGCTSEDVCQLIRRVCERMASCEHHDGDAARWATLADDCIADMPAEELV